MVTHESLTEVPPLTPRREFIRAVFAMTAILSGAFVIHLSVVSGLQHHAAQEQQWATFRHALAWGTAPTGPLGFDGEPIGLGTPVARIEIPSVGMDQVVGEGTTAPVLFDGPGHRIDTPLPGQIGVSLIAGRRLTYGGPFGSLADVEPGDLIKATTAQGEFEYRVVGVRREGDPLPPALAAGSSRLILATTDGGRFMPSGVLRVDADLVGAAVAGQQRAVSGADLPDSHHLMAGDTSTLWAFLLWLQALVALFVGAVWAWHRWGRLESWVVLGPPLLLVSFAVSAEAAKLLPNLI